MKSKLTYDYVLDENRRILQHKDHFRFNTDSKMLAMFMKINKGDRVLDIGTNNGVLLKEADQFDPSFLCGVEILEEPSRIAKENAKTFKAENKILQQDIKETVLEPFDVILCNPPYFQMQAVYSIDTLSLRDAARVEKNLDLASLCQAVKRLLKDNGRFYLVHRPDRFFEIQEELSRNSLYIRNCAFVYDHRDEKPRLVLIEAGFEKPNAFHLDKVWWI